MKWDTDRTNELILRSQAGDADARRQLAEENAPLVRSLVRRFIGRGTDYEELCQVGNIGLLKAVAGFNPKIQRALFNLCRADDKRRNQAFCAGQQHGKNAPFPKRYAAENSLRKAETVG